MPRAKPQKIQRCEACAGAEAACSPCVSRHRRERALKKNPDLRVKCSVPRCDACPPLPKAACKDCKNRERRRRRSEQAKTLGTSQAKLSVGDRVLKPKKKPASPWRTERSAALPSCHRQYVQPVKEPSTELFGCPGCMRKLRGAWRYCDRCESKRLSQGQVTVDGHFQLALMPTLEDA